MRRQASNRPTIRIRETFYPIRRRLVQVPLVVFVSVLCAISLSGQQGFFVGNELPLHDVGFGKGPNIWPIANFANR